MLHRPPTITARAGASGRYFWDLLDEAGRPDPAATRRAGGGHWRQNLITDAGLVALFTEPEGTRRWYGYNTTGPFNHSARPTFCVGDDATPPDPSDNALGGFIGYSTNDGGFGGGVLAAQDDGDDIIVTARQTRVYTAPSAVNLREWGYSVDTSGAPILVRELFRDEADDPVTVPLLAGRKVRHVHDLSVRIPKSQPVSFTVQEFDVGGALVAEHEITGTLTAHAVNAGYLAQVLQPGIQPYGSDNVTATVFGERPTAPAWNAALNLSGTSVGNAGSGAPTGGPSRAWTVNMTEAQANHEIYGLMLRAGNTSNNYSGLLVTFDEGKSLTKTNLQTLSLSVELTFARDA